MVGQIESLGERIRKAADSIVHLGQNTHNITAILNTINGIAEQTNLLALNAAIEAVLSDDQGRWLAVVADEVRALAKPTAESAERINSLLAGLVDSSQTVSMEMQRSLTQSIE